MKNYSGKTINQYYLAKDLGQGGMVVVYKAFDNAQNRDVVVKMIRTEDLDGTKRSDVLQRFTPITDSLMRLNHPTIAPLLDRGFFEDVPYLVAEYLPGGTLKQRMRKQLSLKAAIQVLSPIADALIYAHRNGVLHQDFKPSNVLFHNQDKRPILTDLGIAALFTDSAFDPELFELGFGTPAYMAPEQWRGVATEQSDVYSVGIVFFEMLTGKIANKTETPLAAAFKQNEGLIPDPTELINGLSTEVQHFFFKCLALEPINRFQSMEEMKMAMEHLIFPPDPKQTSGVETNQPQSPEPPISDHRDIRLPAYEATRITPIQEEQEKKANPQPYQATNEHEQPAVARPYPIQEDFHPSKRPDYIKSPVASQPASTMPPIQLQQKPHNAKAKSDFPAQAKQSVAPKIIKYNPWVTALVLGLALGLAHLLKTVIMEELENIQPNWIFGLIGRAIAWLIAGLAIYFHFRLTSRLKLSAVGLFGFLLAGIIPTILKEIVSAPYNDWLFDVALWLLLALAITMMFHGPEKVQTKQGLTLIGGWTIAGVLSVLPLMIFSLIGTETAEVSLYLRIVQGLLLGSTLALAVHNSFKNHFKHDRLSSVKLLISFSVACALSYLIFYGVEDIYLASSLAWLVMTGLILTGIALTWTQPKSLKSQPFQNNPNNPESWNKR